MNGAAWWWSAAAAEQEPERRPVILACHCMRYQECDACREPVQESRDERAGRIMGSDAESHRDPQAA